MRAASTTPIFARLGLAGCLMLAACLTLAACAAPKVGFLRLRGTPPDAIVTVDDVYIGKLARLASTGVRVPEGEHRVTVEAEDFLPHDALVRVHHDATTVVTVELIREPD